MTDIVSNEFEKAFKKNTIHKMRDGFYHINCKKGLWGVSAGLKRQAEQDARHYFYQYWADGEYD